MDQLSINERIKHYRKKAGYKSAEKLSEALNHRWSRASISNYENAINEPPLEFIIAFERLTNFYLREEGGLVANEPPITYNSKDIFNYIKSLDISETQKTELMRRVGLMMQDINTKINRQNDQLIRLQSQVMDLLKDRL